MTILAAADLAYGEITMGLLGGLALFLFGMEQMTDALKAVAGGGLAKLLGRLTKNRFTAAITGAFVTAVIQSSSVTTVLVVGFITAGLMSLQQSIGVILGANIGTTITAQIIAFKITKYALVMITIGFFMLFASKREHVKRYGGMIMGLGLIFFGMGLMSDATKPLRSYQPFIDAMQSMSNPFLGILAAAAFTALVQSSSATTGIVIVLATQGFISLEAGIALAFGANVGTCVTAGLAALGKPRAAARAAVVHLLFNVLGVLIWLAFIPQLAEFVRSVSPSHEKLEGTARLAADTPRQIANAHTIFNIANTFLFIWFTGPLAKLVMRLLPEKPAVVPEILRPEYLDDVLLDTPSLALDRIRLETVRLGRYVSNLTADVRHALIDGTTEDLDQVVTHAADAERLRELIGDYVRHLGAKEMTDEESRRLGALSSIGNNIQHVGETLAVNSVMVGRERLARDVTFSEETIGQFGPMGEKVREAFTLSLDALDQSDVELARRVVAMKPEIQTLANRVTEHLAGRLLADAPDRAVLYRIESQVVEHLLRIYYFSKKIAKAILAEHEASVAEPVVPVSQ